MDNPIFCFGRVRNILDANQTMIYRQCVIEEIKMIVIVIYFVYGMLIVLAVLLMVTMIYRISDF